MTNKKSNESRRKALKSLALGSGAVVAGKSLPESWSKPVVDSVLLPTHAQTTDDSGNLPTERTCCAGVFCSLDFGGAPFYASIQVNSDCTLVFKGGGTQGNGFTVTGSGSVAADGSFTGTAVDDLDPLHTNAFSGILSQDCTNITEGHIGDANFSGAVTPGLTSIDDCKQDPTF